MHRPVAPSLLSLLFISSLTFHLSPQRAMAESDWGVTGSVAGEIRDQEILDTLGPWTLYQLSLDRSLGGALPWSASLDWQASARIGLGLAFEREIVRGDLLIGATVPLVSGPNGTVGLSIRAGVGASERKQTHDLEELTRVSILAEPTLALQLGSRVVLHTGLAVRSSLYERATGINDEYTDWSATNVHTEWTFGVQVRF